MKNLPTINKSVKVCTVCGIEKPLIRFMLDSVSYIKKYGNVCEDCRNKTAQQWIQYATSKKDTSINLGLDRFYHPTQHSFKDTRKSKPTKLPTDRSVDNIFKQSSETWAKIISKQNEDDDDDDGGSGGKVKKYGIDYYILLYTKQRQEHKVHSVKAEKNTPQQVLIHTKNKLTNRYKVNPTKEQEKLLVFKLR